MDLLKRSVVSVGWNMAANVISVLVLFARSVILARLLPVTAFGVYAFASSWVALTIVFATFGLGTAFLHRCEETEDVQQAAAVHFTLTTLFVLAWGALHILAAFWLTDGLNRGALIFLVVVRGLSQLTETPRLLLVRQVAHQRLAVIETVMDILSTLVAVLLALRGVAVWALLATDAVMLLVTAGGLYLWRPFWRPRFAWVPRVVRYYLRFGVQDVGAAALTRALDRLDDLWTGIYLGKEALGFYSRAYTFATYPRQVLATPINQVVTGTYAELKGDTHRLSQAFFRSNALLVRSGFYFGGLLALVIPEFIYLIIGVKWLPMMTTFRLMLLFTLLDPLKATIATLFTAVGRPSIVLRIRAIQLLIMIPGLFLLGLPWGIEGVALAVNVMLLVGLFLLLRAARQFVQFSVRRLFLLPGVAVAVGLGAALIGFQLAGWQDVTPNWATAVLKTALFSIPYLLILFLGERHELLDMVALVRGRFRQP
ncbi:MAG: oligosaccharide flippase family protein [Anaerolinea sp.]|nr:oligosaccharide flippase family protein [Anaerolinea sp.]